MKAGFSLVVLLTACSFFHLSIKAQSAGDYRSAVATGNWATSASWETYNGVSWAAAATYPAQSSNAGAVTIRDGHTITLNANLTTYTISSLTVGEGTSGTLTTTTTGTRTLTIANNMIITANGTYDLMRTTLTVNGTTSISGSVLDGNGTGAVIFEGLVTVNNGGSFSSSNNSAFTFRGGISNNGTFSKTGTGAVAFNTRNQAIGGNNPITINGVVTVTGFTVTNNSTDLTLSSTGNPALTGTGTWQQGTNSVLKFNGQSSNISNTDFSSNTNTFEFVRGGTQTILSATYHNLNISTSGTKTLGGAVTVNGNLVINSGTTLDASSQNLTVSGNTTIAGTFADGNALGTTSLQNVNISGGTINGAATGVVNINGTLTMPTGNGTIGRMDLTVTGKTTVPTGYSLTLNSNTGTKIFIDTIFIDGTGTWTSTAITTAGRLEFRRGIVNNNSAANSFTAGTATFSTNNQSLSGAGEFRFNGAVIVSGTITVTNQCTYSTGITFSSTLDGTVSGSTWKNETNKIVNYSGSATQPMNTAGVLDVSAAGNYFYYNRAGAQSIKPPLTSYYNLTVSGTATKTLTGNTGVSNSFLIESGGTFDPSLYDFSVTGATTIAGTFADGNVTGTSTLGNVDLSGGTINGGVNGVINISGNLSMPTGDGTLGRMAVSVSGTTTIASGRAFTLSNNNGSKLFAGAVTINGTGTWTSTSVITASNLEFRAGIVNNNSAAGSFSAGGATFSTDFQDLEGAGGFSFANAVTIADVITVTNKSTNSNGVTFGSNIDGTDPNSTYANDPNTTTYYAGAAQPMNTGVLEVSSSGNYFFYNRANTQGVKGTTYHHLIVTGGGGTATLQDNTIVNGKLDIENSATLSPGSYDLYVTDTTTIDGSFTDNTNNGSSTFHGLMDINASGTFTSNNNSSVFVFEGGINNDGTFTKTGTGNVTFNSNQDITGTAAMTLAGAVTIGATDTLTYKNTHASGITLSGVLDGSNAASRWVSDVNSTVYYLSATQPMNIGSLDASAGGTNFYYSNGGSQTIESGNYYNLYLTGSGTRSLSGATVVEGDLTIGSSVTLDVVSGQDYSLSIGGDWDNTTGTFLAQGGTVTFNGTSDQAITSGNSNFNNVTIDNDATQVNLNDDLTINGVLTLSDGVLTTGSNRVIITSTSPSAITGQTNISFVNGNLRRNITNNTSTYAFPVGNGTGTSNYYRADIINNNLTGITYIDSRFKALTNHDDDSLNVMDDWGIGMLTYTSINAAGLWEMDPNAVPSGGSYNIRLYIENMTGLSDNNFGPVKRPTNSPTTLAWTTDGGTLNNNDGEGRLVAHGYAIRKNLTSFSEFGVGGGSQGGAGLPIKLISFTADVIGSIVQLKWKTATEINNDFFTVERSQDGINFQELSVFEGAGNSSIINEYSTFDRNPFSEISYYRLKQTDFDGTFTYSDVVSVYLNPESNEIEFTLRPNLVKQSGIVYLQLPETITNGKLSIIDSKGSSAYSENVSDIESRVSSITLPDELKTGLFFIVLSNGKKVWRQKLLIQ